MAVRCHYWMLRVSICQKKREAFDLWLFDVNLGGDVASSFKISGLVLVVLS